MTQLGGDVGKAFKAWRRWSKVPHTALEVRVIDAVKQAPGSEADDEFAAAAFVAGFFAGRTSYKRSEAARIQQAEAKARARSEDRGGAA